MVSQGQKIIWEKEVGRNHFSKGFPVYPHANVMAMRAANQQKLADLEELKKSVLQKAFGGEL